MFASNSCEGKNLMGSRSRLSAAAKRNNFRDVHRRAGRQLLSLMGRVREPGRERCRGTVVSLSLGCLNLKN